jgi:replicative DNA helicase
MQRRGPAADPREQKRPLVEISQHIPPQHIEAERAVLGSIMLFRELLHRVVSTLRPKDFYLDRHKWIYESIIELEKNNDPLDIVSVANQLKIAGQLDKIGGIQYLAELTQQIPAAAHIEHYAEIIRDKSTLRQIIEVGSTVVSEAYQDQQDVGQFLDSAERRIFEIRQEGETREMAPVHEIVKDSFKLIEQLYERKELVTGTATGFEEFDKMTAGLQPSDLIILAGRPSMGKAQPLDTPILTLHGWKEMGALRIGDQLASVDGQPSQVSGVFPQGHRPVYRITFADGRSTECCDEHLWKVHSRHWPQPRILSTQKIRELLTHKRHQKCLWIDSPPIHFGQTSPLPIDPWLLGFLLGDGKQGVHPNPPKEHLKSLGLWGCKAEEKFIPQSYLEASLDVRLQLLQGLLDADGCVEKTGSARFSTTSPQLAKDTLYLFRSLGGIASIQQRTPCYTYQGENKQGRPSYTLNLSHPQRESLFTLARKQQRAEQPKQRQRRLTIDNIAFSRETQTQCIRVTHPSHLYITQDFIVTHNTSLAMNMVTNSAIYHNASVVVFSLEMSKEQLVMRMLCSQGRVDASRLRTGNMRDGDIPRLTRAASELSKSKIFIDDSGNASLLEIRSKCRRVKMEHGLNLIVIDYLQLMKGDGQHGDSREREISDISRGLKALAKELHVPVIALSQLNRSLERRPDKRPVMSDLRESGAIEQDADMIAFVYRDEVYNPDTEDRGIAEIIIGKQRNGPIGNVRVRFFHEYTRFDNLYPEETS